MSEESSTRVSHDGTVAKWWNGDWQYRLLITEVSDRRNLHHIKIESRGPGGSWTRVWSTYDNSQSIPEIEPDGDLHER